MINYRSLLRRIAWTLAKASSALPMCSKKSRAVTATTTSHHHHGRPAPAAGWQPLHEWEEHLRDLLVALGLQEVVTYRMTSPEKEGRITKHDDYIRIANPIAPEKSVLRRSLIASVLDTLEKNIRYSEAFSFFEIGPIFEPIKNDLPNESRKLAIVMTGLREATAWDVKEPPNWISST
jgi:phenylalanyl-tRNA synthetase beta chain